MFFSPWGCSSVGRALEWHSRGQEFNSLQLHHISKGRYHKDIGLFLFSTPKFGKEFRLSPCISAVRQLSAELRDALRRSVCHLRAAAVLQPYAPVHYRHTDAGRSGFPFAHAVHPLHGTAGRRRDASGPDRYRLSRVRRPVRRAFPLRFQHQPHGNRHVHAPDPRVQHDHAGRTSPWSSTSPRCRHSAA